MIACSDCARLTSGRCALHTTFLTAVGPDTPTGWRCPGCSACYAPSVTECARCSPTPLHTGYSVPWAQPVSP